MTTTIVVLRLLHIITGVFWAGALFFTVSVLFPAIRATGPAGGRVMRQIVVVQKYPALAGVTALITLLSGFALYWANSSLSGGMWARTRPAMVYGIGGVTALVAFVVAATVVSPTGARLALLGAEIEAAGRPPTPEQGAALAGLQRRMQLGVRLGASLLGVTVITMAVARYT
jgi:uncharacterized membrane protein